MPNRAIIAGGGTGGHVFPAIALAVELQKRWGKGSVLFVGTEKGLESELVPQHGFQLKTLDVLPIKRISLLKRMKGLLYLPRAYFQSRSIIKQFSPDVVIGVGGYAAGPIVLTAKTMGIPCAILEQNSIPGFTNRILAKLVQYIFTGLPTQGFPEQKVHLVGNPIRSKIYALRNHQLPPQPPFNILVYGGSQGAHAINELMLETAKHLPSNLDIMLYHQSGKDDEQLCKQSYAEQNQNAQVYPFIKDIHWFYERAHLTIARAGAMTISELAVAGLPAILIPFPYAADDHQYHNARYLSDCHGVLLYRQAELDAQTLASEIIKLAKDRALLDKMSKNIRSCAKADAAGHIADIIETKIATKHEE